MAAKINFEKKMKELEEVVKTLESGDAGLDEMLTLYEKGTKITRECMGVLDKAEQKITALVKGSDGDMKEEPFDGLQE